MAEKYSTGLRNLLEGGMSIREALDDFIIKVFSGSTPSDADQAEGGSLLCTISKASGVVEADELSIAKQASIDITVAGVGATVIVAINGVDYTYLVLAADDDLRKVARKVATMLDGIPELHAVAHGTAGGDGKVAVKSSVAGLTFTIAKGGGGGGGTATWTVTDNTIANVRSDALQWGTPSNAQMAKPSEVWSGVNVLGGTAAWFRIVRPDDTGALSTISRRIQGAIGTSGAELNLSNINLVIGATLTIDTAIFNLPVS
jgi:hypothetical protein